MTKSSMCWSTGYVQSIIDFLKTLPGIRGLVEREHSKMMVASLHDSSLLLQLHVLALRHVVQNLL